MKFDLDAVDTVPGSEAGAWLTITQIGSDKPLLDKDGKPVRIKTLGPDSKAHHRAMTAAMQKRQDMPDEATVEDRMESGLAAGIEVMVAVTLAWEGIYDKESGEPVPLTPENAKALYEGFPHIRGQVDAFAQARRNFTTASLKG